MSGVQVVQTRAGGGGWWNNNGAIAGCIAAYQPKGAASLAASYVNLATPGTYDAAPGVAPTLDANGWLFNGSTNYLVTNVVPSSTYSMLAKFSGVLTTGVIAGAGNPLFAFQATNGTGRRFSWAATNNVVSPGVASGVLALCANNGYYNGSLDTTLSSSWTGTPPAITIGGRNQGAGSIASFFGGYIQAVAIYSITLSLAEVSALTTDMNAL